MLPHMAPILRSNAMNNKEKSPPMDVSRSKEAIRTWLRLLSCEMLIEQKLRSLFRNNFSVTLPQFDVLSELERAGEKMTMSELSRELMVSNGNVTGVIDRLEKNGFVTRTRAEHDRRVQYIELTTKGREEFDVMAKHHERWLDDMLSDLSTTDMARLQKLLLKARNSVTARSPR
jgi:DNA-binding MarR family transcriptional regulator